MALIASTLLTGCGNFFVPVNNTPGGTGTGSYVYVANSSTGTGTGTGGTLSAYSLIKGVLTPLSGSPYTLPTGATPTCLVVSPNNLFLYVGTTLGVFLYTIGTDGALTEGNNNTIVYQGPGASAVPVTGPISMVVDSTNSWLLIANKGFATLDALAISPTTGIAPSVTPASFTLDAATPQQMIISPDNKSVFVALGAGGTDVFGFSPTATTVLGSPTQIHPSTTASQVNAVAIDPTSTDLYIAETGSNLLRQFAIGSYGAEIAHVTAGQSPSAVLVATSGTSTYAYVASSTGGTIAGFSTSATGPTALTNGTSAITFPTAATPIGLVEDSTKTYVFGVGSGANPDLWLYNFDATTLGTLDVKTTLSSGTPPAVAIAVTH